MARFTATISMDIPEGADREDVASYIMEAVEIMKGSFHPEHPLRSLDRASIRLAYRDNCHTNYMHGD